MLEFAQLVELVLFMCVCCLFVWLVGWLFFVIDKMTKNLARYDQIICQAYQVYIVFISELNLGAH